MATKSLVKNELSEGERLSRDYQMALMEFRSLGMVNSAALSFEDKAKLSASYVQAQHRAMQAEERYHKYIEQLVREQG